MVKEEGSSKYSVFSLIIFKPRLWKVEICISLAASPARALILSAISRAALFVKVTARMFPGAMPFDSILAIL